jgi:hypothetical protein
MGGVKAIRVKFWSGRNMARQTTQKDLELWFFPKMAQNDRVCDKSLFAQKIRKGQSCAR